MAEEGHPMNAGDDSDFSPASRFKFPTRRTIGVHVLSEHVFCPRAALIANESGSDAGDEEPNLGPRLDLFIDYDEHKFIEAIHQAWGNMRLWLTWIAPALFVALLACYFHSLFAGIVVSLPLLILLAKSWDTLTHIIALVRERARYRAAAEVEIDLLPTEVRRLNWWSLRKAGFDCQKLLDTLESPDGELIGKPVADAHKGKPDWRPRDSATPGEFRLGTAA